MGGTLLLSIRFEAMLSNKHCDPMTPEHSEAETPVYDTSYNMGFITAYVRTVVRAPVGHR